MGSGRATKFAAIAAAALLVAVSVVLVASAAPSPRALKYGCASNLYNAKDVLHYVARPAQCKGAGKKLVRFATQFPVYVCRKEHGGFTAARARRFPYPAGIRQYGPAGLIRLVDDPSNCAPPSQPNESPVTLPGTSTRIFCAAKRGGELRWVQKAKDCDGKEFPVELAKRAPQVGGGNGIVVANPDTATTGEDSATTIDVLANDTGPGNSSGLVVDSTDVTGTTGKVTVNADNTITYDPNGKFESLKAGQSATDSFKYKARKNSAKSADGTVTVTITGVNDAPVAVDDSTTTDENSAKTFAVLGNDTDADGDSLTVASVDKTGTLGSVAVNGNGSITYDPSGKFDSLKPGETATDTFKYKASDGTADSNSATVTATITGVNDAPVLAGVESASLNYFEGSSAAQITAALTVADADNANVHSATVKIGTGFDSAHDALAASPPSGISSAFDSSTGVLTLAGSATKASYETALRSVTFHSAGGASGDRTVSFQAEDGELLNKDSNVVSRKVTVDKAPVATNDSKTLAEDAAATTIDVLGNDSDGGDGGPKTIVSKTNGANGTVAITNGGADLTYAPAANFCGSDSFTYTLNGGSVGTVSVTVTCVNDAPVNTVPGAQTVNEDGNIVFTNAFSVADVDAGSDTVSTTLSVPNGTITVSGSGAAAVQNNGTSSVQVTGTLSDVNSKISSVTYAPDANVNGSRTLSMDSDDGGHSGSGGSLTDHDTVAITINAVNDAPVNSMPAAGQNVDEDTTFTPTPSPSVQDVDAGAGGVRVTLSVDHGVLTLAGTSGLTFSTGTGTNDSTMTFSGTVNQVNAAMLGLTYRGNSNYNGSDTLSLATSDLGNTGSGGVLTDSDSVAFTVNAVNDAPLNTVPSAQATNEDTAKTFSSANSNAISVADPDVAPNDLRVTLSVSHGLLTLSGTSGLAFTTGSGSGNSTMTFTGSPASINTALSGLSYAPAANYDGPDTLSLLTEDLGSTGSGGAKSDSDTVGITVSAQNDAPVNTVPASATGSEDSAIAIAPSPSIADSDAGGSAVQVTLSVLHGGITLGGTSGLTFSTGDGSGDQTMTFTGTIANINTALTGLSYQGNLNFNGSDTLTFTTNDQGNTGAGGPKSDTDSVAITVNPVNDAPVASGDTYSVNEDATLNVPANGVLGNDSDVDAGDTLHAVLVSGPANASSFSLASDGSFSYTGSANFNGSDSFTYKANDGSANSNTVTVDITVNPVNDAPVNSLTSVTQTVNEDTSVAISPSPSISDSDSGGASEKVTLTVASGGLTLSGTTGLTFITGDGSGDPTMVFTGTVADINNALSGLSYQGNLNFNGSDTLTLKTEDQGNTGSGGPLSDTDSVGITVNAVNDGPSNTVPTAQSTNEDTSKVFSTGNSNAISVADVDAAPGSVQVNLTVASGILTLGGTANVTVSGDGTASVQVTGTPANVNTALDGLVYMPNGNFNGGDTLQVVTTDNGNTGTGGPLSDTDTVAITVNAVNDPPVNSVPAATQSVNEDTNLTFNAANSNLISVSDVDAVSDSVRVTLSVSDGTLTLSTTSGLTPPTNDGTSSVTVEGTLSQVNAALDGLKYRGNLNSSGSDTLNVNTSDLGHNPAPAQTDSDSVAITVNPVNDPPVLDLDSGSSGNDSTVIFNETSPHTGTGTQLDPNATLTDVDSATMTSATVTLGTRPDGDSFESLSADTSSFPNITATYTASSGILQLSSTTPQPKADYLAVLKTVRYDNTKAVPNSANRDITFVVNDGVAPSNTATAHVTVVPINAPPILDLNSSDPAPSDSSTSFTEDQTPLPKIAPTANVTDVDDTHMESATLTLQNPQDGNSESLGVTIPGGSPISIENGSYQSGTGVLKLTGHGTKADYISALQSVTYNDTSNTPTTGTRTVDVVVNDGAADSNHQTASVTVANHNDAPVNHVPGAQSTNEDTGLVFTGANAITVSDVDSGSNAVQVTLSVTNGTLHAVPTSGVTIGSNDSGTVTLTGSTSDVNTAMDGLTYSPPANSTASTTLTVSTNDQGNSGGGGAQSDSDTVAIDVNAVNDAPTIAVPTSQAVDEDTALVLSSGNANRVSISDVDAGTNSVKVTLSVAHGALTLNGTTGLSFACGGCAGDGIGDATMTFTGTITNINNALNGMSYQGNLNYNGPDSLSVGADDLGNSGSGSNQTASASVGITVNAVNDGPSNSVPGTQTTNEDTAKTFSTAGANAISVDDVDSGTLTVTLSTNNGGKLTLNGTAGLTGVSGDGTATVTATGTIGNLNNALNGLSYTPGLNVNGTNAETIHMVTSDGSLTAASNIQMNVTAVNDAPVNTPPGTLTVNEDTVGTFSGPVASISDVDAGSNAVKVTLSVDHGSLTLNGTTGLSFTCADGCAGDGTGDATMTFTGTIANINNALNGMSYLGTLNYNSTAGAETLHMTTNDEGFSGSGGAQTSSDTSSISVTPVNDAPTVANTTFNGAANSAIGNTTFVSRNTVASAHNPADGAPATPDPTDNGPVTDRPHKTIEGDVLASDSDVENNNFTVTSAGKAASNGTGGQTEGGGTVTIQPDGDFVVEPKPTTSCSATSDSFTYVVTDDGSPAASSTATVTFPLTGCVWYVNNDDSGGDSGTSSQPFDNLGEANGVAGTGDSIFVYQGASTPTGSQYLGGFDMSTNQKLIGEAADLVVGGDTLHSADLNNRPTLTDTTSDVVTLANGGTVKGLQLDPQGSSGIAGTGLGATTNTIDDVNIVDKGTAGPDPGLDLSSDTGTFNISNLTVDNSGATAPLSTAIGVKLNSAGTVNFASGSLISIDTLGAKALDAASTSLGAGSVFDDITVSGSTTGGVKMSSTTGTTTFGDAIGTDLNIATTSGSAAGFQLASAGTVNVPTIGIADVHANGGPAVDIAGTTTGTGGYNFDDLDSTDSATSGISLAGLGSGNFSAGSGSTLSSNAAAGSGWDFDLNGGSGTISFPGTLTDGSAGSAGSARIQNRSGGTATFSGPITDGADSGGGIAISGNTAGSTVFSNSTKTMNTGSGDAVLMSSNTGHTVSFDNGGLAVSTSTGKAVDATGGGTLNVGPTVDAVTTSNNTVTSVSSPALNVADTSIGSTGLNFKSLSSGNSTVATADDPGNGISLKNTGSSSAGLKVTGNLTLTQGGDATGGTIQHTTSHAVNLDNADNVSLTDVKVDTPARAGVFATGTAGGNAGVTNFTFRSGEIDNAGDAGGVVTDNGISFNNQAGANTKNVDGTLTVTNNKLLGNFGGGITVGQNDGTISTANVSGNLITQATTDSIDAGGIQFSIEGTASQAAAVTQGTFNNNTINNSRDNGIVLQSGNTTGPFAPATTLGVSSGNPNSLGTSKITVSGNFITGDPANKMNTDGILMSASGKGQANGEIISNGSAGSPITNLKGQGLGAGVAGAATGTFLVGNNVLSTHSISGSDGIGINEDRRTVGGTELDAPTLNVQVSNNTVSNYNGVGIHSLLRDSHGTGNVRISNNTVNAGEGSWVSGIYALVGSSGSASYNPTGCYDITGNTSPQGPNDGFGNFPSGIVMDKFSSAAATYKFGIVGLSPSPTTAATAGSFVGGNNPSSALGAGFYAGKRASADNGDNFTSCTLPF